MLPPHLELCSIQVPWRLAPHDPQMGHAFDLLMSWFDHPTNSSCPFKPVPTIPPLTPGDSDILPRVMKNTPGSSLLTFPAGGELEWTQTVKMRVLVMTLPPNTQSPQVQASCAEQMEELARIFAVLLARSTSPCAWLMWYSVSPTTCCTRPIRSASALVPGSQKYPPIMAILPPPLELFSGCE